MPSKIKVLLVDDHAIVRMGYRHTLEEAEDIEVVAEAPTANKGYQLCKNIIPDVVVMDLTFVEGMSGIEATRKIVKCNPKAVVLVASMHQDLLHAQQALDAGAKGYFTKTTAPEVLPKAVRKVHRGKLYFSPEIEQKLKNQPDGTHPINQLAPRELEIMRLMVDGRSSTEIAAALGLSKKTVANYATDIKTKLNCQSSIDLFKLAAASGLVEFS